MKPIGDAMKHSTQVEVPCRICGNSISYTPLSEMDMFRPTICNECDKKLGDEERLAKRAKSKDIMKRHLPYKVFDRALGNGILLNDVGEQVFSGRKPTKKGVYLHGASRTCKTRVLCALASIAIDRGHTVGFRSCPDMLRRYSKSLVDGDSQGLLDRLLLFDILIIDDYGEGKITERGMEHLYMVIDGRLIAGKPIWFTSNFTLSEVMEWMAKDAITRVRATRILKRIEETTQDMKSAETSG